MIALTEFAGAPPPCVKIPVATAVKKAVAELVDDKMFHCWQCQKDVTPRMRDNVLYCPHCDESATLSVKLKSD